MALAIDSVIQGDCLSLLKLFPDESIDCCITSPPYYGLRDYGCDGQIGLEDTPEKYVLKLVEVFREVRRVLKPEGTLWLNLGDSYCGSWGNSGHRPELDRSSSYQREKNTDYISRGGWDQRRERPPASYKLPGLKPKDLIGIPWMIAFALRADGWYLRSDIIWNKPNCMPESVTDRPTKSHEYVFLLSKSERYYYDNEAIKEDCSESTIKIHSSPNVKPRAGHWKLEDNISRTKGNYSDKGIINGIGRDLTGRNKRTVWTINTSPCKEAHFATFPEALVEPCIKAGTSEKGYCSKCGKPWIRQLARNDIDQKQNEVIKTNGVPGIKTGSSAERVRKLSGSTYKHVYGKTIGWLPSCDHDCEPIPGIVLDPFFGAGTTGLVARKHLRHYVGIELNPDYIAIAEKRIGKIPARLDRWATFEDKDAKMGCR